VGRGKKIGMKKFMEGEISEPRNVESISCCTGWGSIGEWKFPNLEKVN
jgi:hypothetical protein